MCSESHLTPITLWDITEMRWFRTQFQRGIIVTTRVYKLRILLRQGVQGQYPEVSRLFPS
jgi:hypothetical protein